MAQSILGNHYLGKSTLQKSDQPFDVTLTQKKDIFAFVTFEGHLLGLDVDALPYSAEDRIRLTASDYVIASFVPHPEESMLFVTQTGKVIHVKAEPGTVEVRLKGQALIPPAARTGVRCRSIRSGIRTGSWCWARRELASVWEALTGAGSIAAGGLGLSIGVIPAEVTR
jgi:hypothetical protein